MSTVDRSTVLSKFASAGVVNSFMTHNFGVHYYFRRLDVGGIVVSMALADNNMIYVVTFVNAKRIGDYPGELETSWAITGYPMSYFDPLFETTGFEQDFDFPTYRLIDSVWPMKKCEAPRTP